MEDIRIEDRVEILRKLIGEKDYKAIRQELSALHPSDIAEIIDEMSAEERVILIRVMPKDQAADVFSYLSAQSQINLASSMNESLMKYIFNELYFDDKIDFLEDIPANFVRTLIAYAPAEERNMINQFLNYPENSAGSLMTIEYVDLRKSMTVKEALERVKATGMDKETIYTCYVLDQTKKLEGIVSLRKLVLSNTEATIEEIMDKDFFCAHAGDDQEEVAETFKKYDLSALPVVDGENRLIGIITVDDILDVIEQETTEDFEKMAAMAPSDEEYLEASVFKLAKARIVWLLVLMISATFTGGIITHFEELLSTAVILTAFIPMLMDTGGNAGNQSSTLIIRGMALGQIERRDWSTVLWKEVRVSLVAGSILALVNTARMLLFSQATLLVTITVSITLLCTVVLAKIIGGLLPIAAKALKLDPAIMAGPLITTIVDAISLIIYFTIAGVLVL